MKRGVNIVVGRNFDDASTSQLRHDVTRQQKVPSPEGKRPNNQLHIPVVPLAPEASDTSVLDFLSSNTQILHPERFFSSEKGNFKAFLS
jgi:hypothetical protein